MVQSLNQFFSFYGVDVSQPTSVDSFACLKGLNLRYAIVRCYESVGRPDPNCAQTVKNAHAGGMEQVRAFSPLNHPYERFSASSYCAQVDAYLFPCPTCGPAAAQVASLFDYWVANGVNVTLLWLDIEGAEYWLGDAGQNQANLLVARAARFAYPAVSNHPRHTLARHGMRSSSTRVSPCSSTSAFTVRPASFTRSARTNFDFVQHR